jgi:hypothetical protein
MIPSGYMLTRGWQTTTRRYPRSALSAMGGTMDRQTRVSPETEPARWTTVACPECGSHAEIESRTPLLSTDGWVEHLKIRCLNRHWFFLPADQLGVTPDLTGP